MLTPVHGEFVPASCQLAAEFGRAGQHGTQHEKRRAHLEAVELGEEQWRRRRVGAVVEGQGDMVGRADAGQGGKEPTPDRVDARDGGQGVDGAGNDADSPNKAGRPLAGRRQRHHPADSPTGRLARPKSG